VRRGRAIFPLSPPGDKTGVALPMQRLLADLRATRLSLAAPFIVTNSYRSGKCLPAGQAMYHAPAEPLYKHDEKTT
jgi:hypothetical protein